MPPTSLHTRSKTLHFISGVKSALSSSLRSSRMRSRVDFGTWFMMYLRRRAISTRSSPRRAWVFGCAWVGVEEVEDRDDWIWRGNSAAVRSLSKDLVRVIWVRDF